MVAATFVGSAGAEHALSNQLMGLVLAHELGHYLGLQHNTAGGNAANLMAPEAGGTALSVEQVEEIQQKLANALARGGDRHE